MTSGVGDWVRYVHPEWGFGLRHPPDWRAVTGALGSAVSLVPPLSEMDGPARPCVSVGVDPLQPGTDVRTYARSQHAALRQVLTDLRELDRGRGRLGEFDALTLLVSYRQGLAALSMHVWFATSEERGYTLAATAPTTGYEAAIAVFETMAGSFAATG